MSQSPGPSHAVRLKQEVKAKHLNLCIVCQRKKDSKGNNKLTSTEDGRKVLIQTSQTLKDDLLKYPVSC